MNIKECCSYKQHSAEVHDGSIHILSGLEPFNEDLSIGLHVSVSHLSRRRITDEELREIAEFFFKGIPYHEHNPPGSYIRHLWESRTP